MRAVLARRQEEEELEFPAKAGMWAADDSDENTVKGLERALQNPDTTSFFASCDAEVLQAA